MLLAAAAHIGPQRFEVVVAQLVAPRRHCRRLAIDDGAAEALEIILREFAQVERDATWTDHVAAVTGDTEIPVYLAPLLNFGIALREARCRTDEQHHAARHGANAGPSHSILQHCPFAAHTFFCRRAATWIGGIQGFSAQATPLRATCASMR